MNTAKVITLAMLVSLAGLFVSCDDDSNASVKVDKTALEASITAANDILETTVEGTVEGQYQPGSKADLEKTIELAQTIVDKTDATESEVNNSQIAVDNAVVVYNGKIITAIAPESLVLHMTFDEGEGTTVADYSANKFTGTFRTGHSHFGAGTATWGTDRYGNDNKSLLVNEGAWVEVPYNAALNPANMTVTAWVKADTVGSTGGRFLGLHSWNGYKFEVPGHGKPFFTAATDDAIFDKDAGLSINFTEWYHLSVTFGGGKMIFYIDGTKVQEVECAGNLTAVSGHNLAIGAGSSKYADTVDNYETDKIIPAEWGGFFNGSIDELRMYNTVLTESQVQSIYNVEKPIVVE